MIASEPEARALVARLAGGDAVAALARCERLLALLAAENQEQNLVSAASLDSAWVRHIADSAQLLGHVSRETSGPWLDLGTGAGFPGLVIALLRPELEVVMVESRTRRVEWLARACAELGLGRARVIGARLEQVESFPAAVISARAFAPLDRLLALSARFSTSDTLWLLPKGRSAWDEVQGIGGWQAMFHVEQSLTDPDAGVIVGSVRNALPASRGKKARSR
jgi:16S rRNA (guanine527-N7)-methyltransferase